MYKNNVEIVVSRYNEDLSWLNEYPFNQFEYVVYNKGDNDNFEKNNVVEIVNIENIPVLKLDSVFKRYCSEKSVDFMSVDVEGFEMDVLRSNDWVRFRPNYLIVEINQNTNKIMRFLKGVGYLNIFNNGTNCIFLDKNH